MFNFLRRRGQQGSIVKLLNQPRDSALSLELPNPYGGKPWLSATLAMSRTPQSQGDMLRLRAHFDSCLRIQSEQEAPALADGRAGQSSLLRFGQQLVAGALREVIARVPADRLAPLTQRRWRSWVDVQFSTAPLDKGADALVPERLRSLLGAGLPRGGDGEPRVGVWSGPAGGPGGGVASLVWLQLDEQDFPGVEESDASGSGFNLNASISQLVEPAGSTD